MVSSVSRSSVTSTSAARRGGPTPGLPRRVSEVAELRLAAQQREPRGARHALRGELRVDRVEFADRLLDADGLHEHAFLFRGRAQRARDVIRRPQMAETLTALGPLSPSSAS